MKRILSIFVLLVAPSFSAVVQPDSSKSVPSGLYARNSAVGTAGLGVPGGIAAANEGRVINTSLMSGGTYDITSYNGTETDVSGYIQAATNAARDTGLPTILMYPPGVYLVATSIKNPAASGGGNNAGSITHRGSGMGVTTLKNYGTFIFEFGSASQFERTSQNRVTSSPSKGSTSVTVSDGSWYTGAGRVMKFSWSDITDDATIASGVIPPISTDYGSGGYTRTQTVLSTGISGNTVSFVPPIMHDTVAGLTAYFAESYFGWSYWVGVEEMTVERADPFNGAINSVGIQFNDMVYPWVKNVEVKGWKNYGIYFQSCYRPEVRGSYIHDIGTGGTNGSGILSNSCTGALIENNIINHASPCIELNFGTSASAITYNFIDGDITTNHGPHNTGVLLYGNIAAFAKDDGYFGSSQWLTAVNNWFHGVINIDIETGTGTPLAILALRRYCFQATFLGNVFGYTGDSYSGDFRLAWGYPNAGNSNSTGNHSEFLIGDFDGAWKGRAKLTARTSDTSGTITAVATSYGTWTVDSSFSIAKIKTKDYGFLTGLSRISGTEVAFTNSGGTLPALNTEFDLDAAGTASWQDINDDVWNTKDFRANILLSTSITNFPTQSLAGGDTIWDPLGDVAAGAPAWWGSCPWYGHTLFIDRSNTAGLSYRDIPAGRRYMDGNALLGETSSTNSAVPGYRVRKGSGSPIRRR